MRRMKGGRCIPLTLKASILSKFTLSRKLLDFQTSTTMVSFGGGGGGGGGGETWDFSPKGQFQLQSCFKLVTRLPQGGHKAIVATLWQPCDYLVISVWVGTHIKVSSLYCGLLCFVV